MLRKKTSKRPHPHTEDRPDRYPDPEEDAWRSSGK